MNQNTPRAQDQKIDRQAAREFSFKFLYHLQFPFHEEQRTPLLEEDELLKQFQIFQVAPKSGLHPETINFALGLVRGSLSHYEKIKIIISRYLVKKSVDSINRIDFTLLILGTYEICFHQKTPLNVVVNECVELAKKYGTAESSALVNAILDKVKRENDSK